MVVDTIRRPCRRLSVPRLPLPCADEGLAKIHSDIVPLLEDWQLSTKVCTPHVITVLLFTDRTGRIWTPYKPYS